ncbi:MAG: Mrp/NBP35 family ATP-binding protein [Phycisphaeraceae bacterium]|nr:Mrp/NBP35 family ATP-binding protein [Phycisphaerales bacterium]MCB9860176.1 Mrp/NBP35 family ATP-binding protein [Phycisphaeraceae bacterium]
MHETPSKHIATLENLPDRADNEPMSFGKEQIIAAARRVKVPGTDATLDKIGSVEWAAICDGHASVKVHLPDGIASSARASIAAGVDRAVTGAAIAMSAPIAQLLVEFVDHQGTVIDAVTFRQRGTQQQSTEQQGDGHRPIGGLRSGSPQSSAQPLANVKHIIAVGAGKGGVGKSTVSVNLAVGLAKRGHAVGLLDGDIYGPSLPTMLGLDAMDQVAIEGMLQPFNVHGIKAITIGKLVDSDKPLIWRGPMAHGAFKQLTEQTSWGELDYLIVDLPPGTGDIALTMAQTLRTRGAVIVCTPQRVALDDAQRALRMFQQLGIDILGVVENMNVFIGDDGKHYDIFGSGGAQLMAQRTNVPYLGGIPITMALRENSDNGNPSANFAGKTALNDALETLVTNLENQVALAEMKPSAPTMSVS